MNVSKYVVLFEGCIVLVMGVSFGIGCVLVFEFVCCGVKVVVFVWCKVEFDWLVDEIVIVGGNVIVFVVDVVNEVEFC